ncbi:hypothetical protein J19TS1_52550 [Heyndrickxia oleronia]|nr:hypothetical protein J19TS1_52550 [Heyndrickxia oleronia]
MSDAQLLKKHHRLVMKIKKLENDRFSLSNRIISFFSVTNYLFLVFVIFFNV